VKFLAHRANLSGKNASIENSILSIAEAMFLGFGVEIDIRDRNGEIVVSHDPPNASAPTLTDVFAACDLSHRTGTFALNIKSDGIGKQLLELLQQFQVKNYFCFDMSTPETLKYQHLGIRFFTRLSEYEPTAALYEESAGVWMDMFRSNWVTPSHIEPHFKNGKQIALVSPELHNRERSEFWTSLDRLKSCPDLYLCTDYTLSAQHQFHE
jgi:hypothetical protein